MPRGSNTPLLAAFNFDAPLLAAGFLTEKGLFTTNDHAYVLTVKSAYEKKIDLEWFSYVSEKYTKNCVTSKDSNGTFNKEIFLREQIDIASYDMQREIVGVKKNLHALHLALKKFISVLDRKEYER